MVASAKEKSAAGTNVGTSRAISRNLSGFFML